MKHSLVATFTAGLLLTPALALGAPRTHDGFYLRGALGFGSMSVSRDGSVSGAQGSGAGFNVGESTIDGGVGTTELSIGGSLSPGLVLHGLSLAARMPSAKVKSDAAETDLPNGFGLWMLGIGLDWFPDPQGGFHFGGALGLAVAGGKAPEASLFENLGGAGGGFTLGVGYDFWIADQWSLGANLRFLGATVHGESTVNGVTGKEDDSLRLVGLYFSVLYH